MRPNRKYRPKKIKPTRALAKLPAADAILARSREIELAEQRKLRETICDRIGRYRREVTEDVRRIVSRANEAREIGLLILKDWEGLPGKQMTIDFWQQKQELYIDPSGSPILLEQLKWFVKVAMNEPQPITDLRVALSYRQECFGAGGFLLIGDAPGGTASGQDNYFLSLTRHFGKWTQEIETGLKALEQDANFGPVKGWPSERRLVVLAKVEPLHQRLSDFYGKLKAIDA